MFEVVAALRFGRRRGRSAREGDRTRPGGRQLDGPHNRRWTRNLYSGPRQGSPGPTHSIGSGWSAVTRSARPWRSSTARGASRDTTKAGRQLVVGDDRCMRSNQTDEIWCEHLACRGCRRAMHVVERRNAIGRDDLRGDRRIVDIRGTFPYDQGGGRASASVVWRMGTESGQQKSSADEEENALNRVCLTV